MKILFHHRIRSKDGQYVHIEELTRALSRLGHEIIFVGPTAIEQEEFGSDAGLVALLKKRLPSFLYEILEFSYSIPAFLRLWRAVRVHRPDGIYERYSLFFPAGVWVRKLMETPFLLEINAPLLEERSRYAGLKLTNLARWSEKYVWQGADVTLPVTQVLAGYVRLTGVQESRIVVIPNGVDRVKFGRQPARDPAKQLLGLEGRLVLGFTGFLREWHKLEQVVDWISDHPGPSQRHLLITGDGPARQAVERRAKERHISHAVTITGVVAREEVSRYVAAYDVALQPAVVAYASPLKLFEYLALGCAILAPSTPNICEVLSDGDNALLFDPADDSSFSSALQRICDDDSLRKRLGENARLTIEKGHYTWDHNALQVIQLFERLGARTAVNQPQREVEQSIQD